MRPLELTPTDVSVLANYGHLRQVMATYAFDWEIGDCGLFTLVYQFWKQSIDFSEKVIFFVALKSGRGWRDVSVFANYGHLRQVFFV